MYLYCKIINKECAFAGQSQGDRFCGRATGETTIDLLPQCPLLDKRGDVKATRGRTYKVTKRRKR